MGPRVSDRRCLYMPDSLWDRIVAQAARDSLETGERITPSKWVRAVVEEQLRIAEHERHAESAAG